MKKKKRSRRKKLKTKMCSSCTYEKPTSEFHKFSRSKDGLQPHCKTCDSARGRDYRKRNKEEIKERKKKYWEREKHRFLSRLKVYREKNREKVQSQIQEWAKNHRGHLNEYKKKWRAETGKGQIYFNLRRQREKNSGGNGLSSEEWNWLLEVFNHTCPSCGKKKKLTVDHVVPLSKGGAHDISNIQPLCSHCNSVKGTKTIDYRPAWG